jgi:hypothetical protein
VSSCIHRCVWDERPHYKDWRVQTEGYEVSCQDKPVYYIIEPGNSTSVGSDVPTCHGRDSENRNRRWNQRSPKYWALSWVRTIRGAYVIRWSFRYRWAGGLTNLEQRTYAQWTPHIYTETIVYFRKENKFKTVKTWPDQCMYAVLQAQKRTHAIKV